MVCRRALDRITTSQFGSTPSVKVLFLAQRVPFPPDRGDRITTHHVLRHFLDRGDEVRIGALAEESRDLDSADVLRREATAVCAPLMRSPRVNKLLSLRGMLTGEALTLPYFRNRELAATVTRWCAEDPPDVVFVYSSSMAQYALDVPGMERAVRVMQFAELDSDKWRQYAEQAGALGRFVYRREARNLLRFETRVAKEFDISLVVSQVEKELFEQLIPGVTPAVVANGVDVDHFASAGDATRDPHTAVFTGVMNYEPNVDAVLWFAKDCWPQVRAQFPDARFLIVGSKPTAAVQQLAALDQGIEVTGRVEEIPPYLDRAAVAVAPLRLARGVQNKVLEAMSMGLPVIATTSAAQGLGTSAMQSVFVHDDSDAIAKTVCRLFDDSTEARSAGARAAALVRSEFRWENSLKTLDDAIAAARAT